MEIGEKLNGVKLVRIEMVIIVALAVHRSDQLASDPSSG